MTWPVVDGVLSGLFLVAMVGAITEDESMDTTVGSNNDDASKGSTIASTALVAVVAGASAYVGYRRVSSCRRARETFQAQYSAQPYGYGAYPQPYPQAYPPPYPAQQQQPQPYPPAPAAPPTPLPPPAANALGTEGDVCAANTECATGLSCTSNVCMRPAGK